MSADALPPGERAEDEITANLAALAKALRNAGPDFHLRGKVKGLTISKGSRGVWLELRFDSRGSSPSMPGRLRIPVSRALAQSARQQLNKALDS